MTANYPGEQFKYRSLIIKYLQRYIKEQGKSLSKVSRWGPSACKQFASLSGKGKMIRGELFLYIYEKLSHKDSEDMIPIAAALEITQTSLLIHDDIIDKDKTRRGIPALSTSYGILGAKENLRDPEHFGDSMALCIGDIGLFWAFSILNKIKSKFKTKIINKFTEEFTLVGVAQMSDIYNGYSRNNPSLKEIESIYLYKTARYTFSVPLALGAIIANANQNKINILEKIGEYLGIIFQIRDDEIGIFGNEQKTGKICGSDIREGKKTIYFYHLVRYFDKDTEKFKAIWGNPLIISDDIKYIQNLIINLGIQNKVQEMKDSLRGKAIKIIQNSDLDNDLKEFLSEYANTITETTIYNDKYCS